MKNLLTIFSAAILLISSCNTGTKDTDSGENSKLLTVTELLADAPALTDQEITVTGMVFHVCKHGGQKMFILDKDQESRLLIRVTESIPEFDVALEGSTVEVTGKLIATVTEVEGEHNGEGQHEASAEASTHDKAAAADCESDSEDCETEASEEDCAVEESMSEAAKNISYHIAAVSFKEVKVE